MKFTKLPLKGAYIIEPEPFRDNRGMFSRIFCKKEFKIKGLETEFVQVNHSLTNKKGAVRGMHYQLPPKAESKIVKCVNGSVFDVIIDLRKDSKTFLQWYGSVLTDENMRMLYIPKGFAHGFQTLENNCELLYFHDEFYSPRYEKAIRYNDPLIGINWPIQVTDLSDKDKNHPLLNKNFKGIKLIK